MIYGRLTIFHPDGRRQVVTIERPLLRIGSAPENDLVLDDSQVTPLHAQILSDTRGSELLDISGTGATDLDGTRLTGPIPLPLHDGSVVRIGATLITVNLGPAAPPTNAADASFLNQLLNQAPPPAQPGAPVTPVFGTPLPPDPDIHSALTVQSSVVPQSSAPRPAQLFIKLSEAVLAVEAGQSARITATISNRSEIVDQILIAVEGAPDEWVSISPRLLNLYPGDSADVTILITPSRRPESRAGLHELNVTAQMQTRLHEQVAAGLDLTINPFDEFHVTIDPTQMAGWRGATYTMRLENAGNREQFFQYRGSDDENVLRILFSPPPLLPIEPGETRSVRLRVRCSRARFVGDTPQMYGFRVVVSPTEGIDEQNPPPPREASARFVQRPLFQSCVVPLALIATVFAMLLGCFWMLRSRQSSIARIVCPVSTVPFLCPTITPTLVPGAELTALPTPTLIPTPDAEATVAVVSETQQAEVTAAAVAIAQTQTVVANADAAEQTAVAVSVAQTQTAQTQSFAQTSTAVSLAVAQTQTAQTVAQVQTSTAQAIGVAATMTSQAIGFAQTQTAGAAAATTLASPTPTLVVAGADRVIVFDRVLGIPVTNRIPLRGDEYVAQDAIICFYQPVVSGGERPGRDALFYRSALEPGKYSPPKQAPAPGMYIDDVRVIEGNSGTINAVFTVTWIPEPFIIGSDASFRTMSFGEAPAKQSGLAARVDFVTIDGSAVAGSDYTFRSGTLALFSSDGVSAATAQISVPVLGDTEIEADETFAVFLSDAFEGSSSDVIIPIRDNTGIGTIVNDDFAPPPPPTSTSTSTIVPTVTSTSTRVPATAAPVGDVIDCRPPVPNNTTLRLLQPVIYPPPVRTMNNGPFHVATADEGEDEIVGNAVSVINFQRNMSEVSVTLWYPGTVATTYVMFVFDERGEVITTVRRDAIGVPAIYQLNVLSIERPIRQVLIEARDGFGGAYGSDYIFRPNLPALVTRVEARFTTP